MKKNKDGTIHFELNEWTCTDPDECQFCRVIDETTFEFIQSKNRDKTCHSLADLNDNTTFRDWYEDTININDYDSDQLGEETKSFSGILDGVTNEQDRNQLIAECIFENSLFDC